MTEEKRKANEEIELLVLRKYREELYGVGYRASGSEAERKARFDKMEERKERRKKREGKACVWITFPQT